MRRIVLVGLAVAIMAVGASVMGPGVGQPAQAQTTFDVDLVTGWNLVSWLGQEAGPAEALGEAGAAVGSVNTFNAGNQSFETFSPGAPRS